MAPACGHCGKHHEAFVTVCPVTGARLGNASYTLVNDDELLVGSVLAERYHVRDILGQGSTGTVFGIEHLSFGRNAAMKVLRPRYTSLDTIRHVFQSETRAALGIIHPSLCEVFDVGTLPDGAPFFVMERLEGDTLASRLGRERFSAAAAVDLMMQLLSAMDAVHERQVLLRDLRPQNVFLAHRRGCRPVVKLLDVGLARLITLERVQAEWDVLRAVTSTSDATGLLAIPYYLSPERTRGDQGLEPTSDIFVAAVILYEALTGQKPFAAQSWNGLIGQITKAQPPPLNVLRPDLPEELGALLARAMAYNPRERPPSAREMQEDLRGVFDGTRRGSASMRAVPVAMPGPVSAVDSMAHTPLRTDRLPEPMPPSSRATDKPPAPSTGDLYDDETRADQQRPIDEASADHPIRTLRPPAAFPAAFAATLPVVQHLATTMPDAEIDVDVDIDMEEPAATSRGSELETTLDIPRAWKERNNEEDETATMKLTPEIRERIERMTKRGPPSAIEDSSRPPPTRRIKP
jgi:serine/threonine protein kinase